MGRNKIFSTFTGLPKSIYILAFAKVITCIGNFVFPFLTLYLTTTMGMSEAAAGILVTVGACASVPGNILGGSIADRIGRKKVIVGGLFIQASILIICGFLGNSEIIPALLIMSMFFSNAAIPPNTAMVTDLTGREEDRNRAFSLIYLATNVGCAIGPIIAGFLFNSHVEWIFFGDGITTMLALIPVILFVPETKPTKKDIDESSENKNGGEKAESGSIMQVLLKRPNLLIFSAISAITSMVYAQHSFSLPIQLNDIFGREGSKAFGFVMTTNALTVVILTTFLTAFTKRLKPVLNITLSCIFFAVGFGMMFIVKDYSVLIISAVIWSMGEILGFTNFNVYVAEHAPISHRGRFSAIMPFISGMGYLFGPILTGAFIKANGIKMVWPLVFFLSMGGGLLMYSLYLVEKVRGKGNTANGDGPAVTLE